MATLEITADSFADTLKSNDIVLLDWWAPWCGPCAVFGTSTKRRLAGTSAWPSAR